ncbi:MULTISPECIES: hypothetical protein [Stenotrophomonas]|uniref:hypothetical protein n=1 Tax=Stenotrophomonas TaxID=40323 RepID=UPI00038F6EA6|nr:hypothetical protein [Stenotrophomonas maltophilia]EQM88083.1 hypothetical protein L681_00775 [Stenotrophomonas maltophilia MF89]OHY71887.1 hypothetical protein BB780_00305 [Stenotrophomonas maltophilia]
MTDHLALEGPALRTFFRLAEEWSLSTCEGSNLLGIPDESLLERWCQGAIDQVDCEVLVRISLLLGIYRALHTVFSDRNQANGWLRRVQVTGKFQSTSALAHMLKEGFPGLQRVHAHLMALLD